MSCRNDGCNRYKRMANRFNTYIVRYIRYARWSSRWRNYINRWKRYRDYYKKLANKCCGVGDSIKWKNKYYNENDKKKSIQRAYYFTERQRDNLKDITEEQQKEIDELEAEAKDALKALEAGLDHIGDVEELFNGTREHLTLAQDAKIWVDQQREVRKDYIKNLGDLQTEADTKINNILNNTKSIQTYIMILYFVKLLVKVAILSIIGFLFYFIIKILRSKDLKASSST